MKSMQLITENDEIISKNALVTKGGGDRSAWDFAHDELNRRIANGEPPIFIEPNKESNLYEDETKLVVKSGDGYLRNWPAPADQDNKFIWHLNQSQLKMACDRVKREKPDASIKIAIIDTGFQENHKALPEKMTAKGISFIKGEEGEPAIDINSGTAFEQNGHGTATMSILAGGKVEVAITDGVYEGYFGAIPFAEILPIRICETVALIWTDAFVKAVDYAIAQNCEVISMSMAGVPTKAWARAVNRAYESGVVLVSAAGNSWTKGIQKILPKRVLYPARWSRVIAATGVASDGKPYVADVRITAKSEGGEFMQGNYGPERAMQSAVAAYTPNVSWATMNDKIAYFRLDGGGTSSATPQVAAAVALWLCFHREQIDSLLKQQPNEKWRKVELVKNALFASADKSYGDYRKYFGHGTLRANDTLDQEPNGLDLEKADEAIVSFFGILDLLGLLLRLKSNALDNVKAEMLELEVLQRIHEDKELHKLLDYDEAVPWSETDKAEVREKLLASDQISEALRQHLADL